MTIPILKLRNTLLTSIQVELTDDDALEFQSDVLDSIRTSEAEGLVIDITALEVVDSYLARILNDTATMANLLGTETVICGMQPAVSLTLVEMGRQLIGVASALNLDQAMEKVEMLLAERAMGGRNERA